MSVAEDHYPPDTHDDYDEEADSDFNDQDAVDDLISSSSEDDDEQTPRDKTSRKDEDGKPKRSEQTSIDLDSGDEATIQERQRVRRKQRKRGKEVDNDSDDEAGGWRAKTRAMRLQDQEERKRNKLATSKGSTIDVDKLWEEMNRPGPLPPVQLENEGHTKSLDTQNLIVAQDAEHNKENVPTGHEEEMITIKRKFHFAGEVHEEEKVVAKSSAEARLWLSQQENKNAAQSEAATLVQRPLRKVSRFDPNYNNLGAFKTNFNRHVAAEEPFKGPRLNVVEKSKMDWAAHVDAEGLKDELDIHAKAKEGYHSRMEFLNQVEQRKDAEARQARNKH